MNRYEEFTVYKNELDENPAQLNTAVERAKVKLKKQSRIHNFVTKPLSALCALMIAFMLLINLSPQVALAVSEVPGIGELALAITLNPSIKNAIGKNYLQHVDQTYYLNDVEITIKYLIMDETLLTVLFTSDSPDGMCIQHAEIEKNGGVIAYSGGIDLHENKELHQLSFEISDDVKKFPAECDMILTLIGENDYYESMSIKLYPDKNYIRLGKKIKIDEVIEVLGQKLNFKNIEIYPTKMLINYSENLNNSMEIIWYGKIVDENGNLYEDSPYFSGYESPYFTDTKQLNIIIDKVFFIDKKKQYGLIDPSLKTIEKMPQGVDIDSMYLENGNLIFTIKRKYDEDYTMDIIREYRDNSGLTDSVTFRHVYVDEEGFTYTEYIIENYRKGFSVGWEQQEMVHLETPIVISVDLE